MDTIKLPATKDDLVIANENVLAPHQQYPEISAAQITTSECTQMVCCFCDTFCALCAANDVDNHLNNYSANEKESAL